MQHMAAIEVEQKRRTALVTGATRGIGLAIALRLKADGLNVISLGRGEGDLSNPEELDDLVQRAAQWRPDILINCAGISQGSSVRLTLPSTFYRTMAVNVFAPFALASAVIPHMVNQSWGRVVNIGSIYSMLGRTDRAAYIVSKHAIDGLTKSLSSDYARHGVLTNTVSPGVIDTDMTRGRLDRQELEETAKHIPLGRIGEPKEVARLVAWLASNANTYVTGQNIAIDGGFVSV